MFWRVLVLSTLFTPLVESLLRADTGFSFADYEVLGGVPARVIRPSESSSKFRCHVVSRDGTTLAMVETNGTVRLMSTADYSTIAEARVFTSTVDHISFVDGTNNTLISIDNSSAVVLFSFTGNETGEETSERGTGKTLVISCRQWIKNYSKLWWYHISGDGTMIAYSGNDDEKLTVSVINLREYELVQLVLLEKEHIQGMAIVSNNGKSVLACTMPTFTHLQQCSSVVYVWPDLEIASSNEGNQTMVKLTGDRATWGLDGEYLLLWSSEKERPLLSVYKTARLQRSKEGGQSPIAQRSLNSKLANWKALMLDPCRPDEQVKVLVCEIGRSGRRRFFVWDVSEDSIVTDLTMTVQPQKQIDMPQWEVLHSQNAWDVVECDLPPTSKNAYIILLCEDIYSKFCISSDRRWIGVMSMRYQSCSISSTSTGGTVWTFALPKEMMMKPADGERCPRIFFDPAGQHLVVVSTNAMILFALPFLGQNYTERVQGSIPGGLFLDELRCNRVLAGTFSTLPSSALARTLQLRNGNRYPYKNIVQFQDRLLRNRALNEFVCSSDFTCAICVASSHAFRTDARSGDKGLTFDGSESQEIFFLEAKPNRLFLYRDERDGNEAVAFVDIRHHTTVVEFYHMIEETTETTSLEEVRCIQVTRSQNDESLVLLVRDGVCFFDLQKREIDRRIKYEADFDALTKAVASSATWISGVQSVGGWIRGARRDNRISHHGQVVLLAWDTKSRRSITVSPTMTTSECTELIQAAGASLSEFCAITSDGKCTLFADVDSLSSGELLVGVFNEQCKRVTHRVQVIRNIKIDSLVQNELNELLSGFYFGLAKDGTELFTLLLPLSSTHRKLDLEEHIAIHTVYSSKECVPTYSWLMSDKSISKEEAVNQVFTKLTNNLPFNIPLRGGMSMFQESFVSRDKISADCIASLAKEHNFELSFEWTSHDGQSVNILTESISLNSATDVKKAISFIGSPTMPFERAAAAIRKSFNAILVNYPDVLQDILLENFLIVNLCTMEVSAEYLDPKRRDNAAVHVRSSDSLHWAMLGGDPRELGSIWEHEASQKTGAVKKGNSTSSVTATLMAVCIEDVAKVGMNGILRPLLFRKAPAEVFASMVVKCVVLYKWYKIWKRRFIKSAARYAVFVICFNTYAYWIGLSPSLSNDSATHQWISLTLLSVVFIFGVLMLHEEMTQLKTFIEDGMKHFKQSWWGVRYFLSSRWNLLDLSSCLLLLVMIPLFHVLAVWKSDFDDWHSVVVAIEAVLVTVKIWYFAQPFRGSGALVLMVDNIIKDCIAFLALAFVVLFGFAAALHTLYRGVTDSSTKTVDNRNETDISANDDASAAFGGFYDSLLTLVFALVGNFEPDVFRDRGKLTFLIQAMFVLYVLGEMIVMLNLLIAIMGDTFDRVKSTEHAQLLMGRASFIDACEAALSVAEARDMETQIGSYLHVVMSEESDVDEEVRAGWLGKLKMLERDFRDAIKRSEDRVREKIESERAETVEIVNRKMMDAVGKQEQRFLAKIADMEKKVDVIQEQEERNAKQLETILEKMERIEQLLTADRREASETKSSR